MLRVFAEHGVDYVLIGGLAATAHGSVHITTDVLITPSRDRGSLERLAAALRDLRARVRVDGIPDGLPFDCSAEMLRNVSILNLTTQFGDLDLTFAPSGTSGFEDLRQNAIEIDVHGTRVVVAALADIIRSKEAANRVKDRLMLPALRHLQKRLSEES